MYLSLQSDGFNVQVSYSHDEQKELNAAQRDFAKSGVQKFTNNGKQYATWQTSINSPPANVEVVTANDDVVLNTDLLNKNGCTQANTFARGGAVQILSLWVDLFGPAFAGLFLLFTQNISHIIQDIHFGYGTYENIELYLYLRFL